MEDDLITLKDARERLGISKMTMARLVKEGRFTIYENPLDRREKLVPVSEVDAVAQPKVRQMPRRDDQGKAKAA